MKIYEVKDVVRENFSRTAFPHYLLDAALDHGRREVEKQGNWWWMRRNFTDALVAAQSSYNITNSTSDGFNRPNYKEIIAVGYRESGDTQWFPVAVDEISLEDARFHYPTDADGPPELAITDSGATDQTSTMTFFPIPDLAYQVNIWLFEWTSNPSSNTATEDDLLKRFPEALIYGSMIWGFEMILKDLTGAQYWRAKLRQEIQEIQRFDTKRMKLDILRPYPGRPSGNFRTRNRTYGSSYTWL